MVAKTQQPSTNGGELLVAHAPEAARPLDFADVFRAAIDADDSNLSSYARQLHWTAQLCTHYRRGVSTPSVARLLEAIDSGRMSANLHLMLLLLLARGRFVVSPAPPDGAPSRDQAEGLRRQMIEVRRAGVELDETINRALEDGRIDATEESEIAAAAARKQGLIHGLLFSAAAICQRTVGAVRSRATGWRRA